MSKYEDQQNRLRDLLSALATNPYVKNLLTQYIESQVDQRVDSLVYVDDVVKVHHLQGEVRCLKELLTDIRKV